MPDIFGRTKQILGGAIPVDAANIAFAGDASGAFGVGMLSQNLQINFQQQINRIYEIGTQYTYFIGGRSQGQLSVGRIIGPKVIQVAFYHKYGNICNAITNVIQLTAIQGGCGGIAGFLGAGVGNQLGTPQQATYTISYCVITNVGISLAAEQMIMNENLQTMFVGLDVQ